MNYGLIEYDNYNEEMNINIGNIIYNNLDNYYKDMLFIYN